MPLCHVRTVSRWENERCAVFRPAKRRARHTPSVRAGPRWCIGAGAFRNLVWDALHGYKTPSKLADVDVAYFDPSSLAQERDRDFQAQLSTLVPRVPVARGR